MLNQKPFPKILVEKSSLPVCRDFCCHAYSLRVHRDAEILKHHEEIFLDMIIHGRVCSWGGFSFLAGKGFLEDVDDERSVRDGDIILYVNSADHLRHSGRMKNGNVVSKWGGRATDFSGGATELGGDVWEHGWEDVSPDYKDDRPRVRFIRVVKDVSVENLKTGLLEYKEYLQSI